MEELSHPPIPVPTPVTTPIVPTSVPTTTPIEVFAPLPEVRVYNFPSVLDLNAPVPLESPSSQPSSPEPLIAEDFNPPKSEEIPYKNLTSIIDRIDLFKKQQHEFGQGLQKHLDRMKHLVVDRSRILKLEEDHKEQQQRELFEVLRKTKRRKEEIIKKLKQAKQIEAEFLIEADGDDEYDAMEEDQYPSDDGLYEAGSEEMTDDDFY